MVKEIEIDEALQADITKSVVESLDIDNKIKEASEAAAKAAAEAVFAKFDKPAKKDIEADEEEADEAAEGVQTSADLAEKSIVKRYFAGDSTLAKQFPALTKSKYASMSKERRFFLGVKALMNNDQATIKELNDFAGELYAAKAYENGIFSDMAQKANYANDATSADGGALVPDPEFNTTVYNNLPKYGMIFADGNPQSTDRTAVYALSLTGTIAFTNVAEAGVISGSKLTFNRGQKSLLKYAAIVPATQELTEDSIVDYWQIVTNEVARAYGLAADSLVFTDTTYGILHQTGVLTHSLISGGAGTTLAWDDLLASEGKVEDALDTSDFVWYMRKETYFTLAQTKASTSGVYLADSMLASFRPNPNNPTTPWGTPVKFTRVLPKASEAGANQAFALFGTLKNTNFYNKNGLALTMLTEAVVKDAGGSDFNLATQDGIAMRVVVRILHILPAGNASKFVAVGTGTVS